MDPKFSINLSSPLSLPSPLTHGFTSMAIDSDGSFGHLRSLSEDSYFFNMDRILVSNSSQSDDEEINELQRMAQQLETKHSNLSAKLSMLQEQRTDMTVDYDELKMEIEELTEEARLRDIYNKELQEEVGFLREKASGMRATIADHPIFGEFYNQIVLQHQAHVAMPPPPPYEQHFKGQNIPNSNQQK